VKYSIIENSFFNLFTIKLSINQLKIKQFPVFLRNRKTFWNNLLALRRTRALTGTLAPVLERMSLPLLSGLYTATGSFATIPAYETNRF